MRRFLLTAFFALLATGRVVGAPKVRESLQSKPLEELMSNLKKTPESSPVIHALRMKGDKKAIPALREALQKAKGKEARQDIGWALVELGDDDQGAWVTVAGFATSAAEGEGPLPVVFGDDGDIVRGKKNPAFLDWCKANGRDPDQEYREVVYGRPHDVSVVARTQDRRGIPILMRALRSKNPWIVAAAAEGLAKFQHKLATPEIIAACERFPRAAQVLVGQFLVFFGDKTADDAASRFVSDSSILEARRKQAREKGAKGLFKEY